MKDQLANKMKGEKALAIAKYIERPVIRLWRGVTCEMLRPLNLVYVRPGKNTREAVIQLHEESKTTNEIAVLYAVLFFSALAKQ